MSRPASPDPSVEAWALCLSCGSRERLGTYWHRRCGVVVLCLSCAMRDQLHGVVP